MRGVLRGGRLIILNMVCYNHRAFVHLLQPSLLPPSPCSTRLTPLLQTTDNCFHRGRFGYPEVSFNRYNKMAQALNDTGRSILYSLCNWGEDYVHTWGMSIANSWRMSGDIYDSFTRPDDLCACHDAADPHCVAPGMFLLV